MTQERIDENYTNYDGSKTMWNRIISYMLFPFQLLESCAKPGLQWWNDDADDDTGEWGGICVFWAGPCVTQLCVLSSTYSPPPPHYGTESSSGARLRRHGETHSWTLSAAHCCSVVCSVLSLLSLPTAAAAHAGCSSIKLSVQVETSSM